MSPIDLQDGGSPDNSDCVFAPGNVSSRPGLQKVFSSAFGGNVTITGAKSYIAPDGTIYNLYFDSSGKLYAENQTAAPGVRTQIYQVPASHGLYMRACSAFGRAYIAISDGNLGADVPLQFDGTFLDRITQDGPGAPPTVRSVALPASTMAVSAPPAVLTVVEVDPAGGPPGGPYTTVNIFVSSTGSALVGGTAIIAGNSSINGSFTILEVYPGVGGGNGLIVGAASLPIGTVFGLGGTCTLGSGSTMVRAANTVTVQTTAPHNLQVGYQAQISNVPASAVGGGITSIVVNNEATPGVATITTASVHGLVPGAFVTINGVSGVSVGGGISTLSRQGGIVTAQTVSAHGLAPGSAVTIAGASVSSFNTSTAVVTIPGPNQFTYYQTDSDATATGGTVTLDWPILDTATPSYFEVQSAPTANKFTVALNYSDGTWTSGAVSFAWAGSFFVASVPNANTFTYQQYGPDATTAAVGTVTPYGLAAPGKHQLRLSFLTRQGYQTKPSPPVTFEANGGQYISVSNVAIGPPNVVARILEFTGAEGSVWYYIPVPAQSNGQQVSTATQINDNTSTAAILDFSDNTLFNSISTSIPGNNTANQRVLDGALSFSYYNQRLIAFGQRNNVQGLLNMGFEGGALPTSPTIPTGWDLKSGGGALSSSTRSAAQWSMTASGTVSTTTSFGEISQSFYQDAYGAPLAAANTLYKFRCFVSCSATDTHYQLTAKISSFSAGFVAFAGIPGSAITTNGGWVEAVFSAKTPATIPADLTFDVYLAAIPGIATPLTVNVDEMSVIYAAQPTLDQIAYASYVGNPEAFDGVTGKFGPVNDQRKIMGMAILRDSLCMLTQDPAGRLHETNANGVTEPSGWTVNEIASNCGAVSANGITQSQSDDSSASGGEEWFAWASWSGAQFFAGDQPWLLTQEITPNWNQINPAAYRTIWALNDPRARCMYFGLPTGTATAPDVIYYLNYQELQGSEIANSGPIKIGMSGKLLTTDKTRKWSPWQLSMNGAALMYQGSTASLQSTFFAGNGVTPGASTANAFGNLYVLNPAYLTDDDYGLISPYYTTYFFVSREQEQGLQLGSHRKVVTYLQAFVAGIGNLTISAYPDALSNQWPLQCVRAAIQNPTHDLEWGGGNAQGGRIAFKFTSSPSSGTNNSFQLSKVVVALRPATRMPVRGSL